MNTAMAEHSRIERNKITPQLREVIRIRDGNQCQICLESVDGFPWEVDHIIPLVNGGTSELGNLQLTHRTCNRMKGAGADFKFRKTLTHYVQEYEAFVLELESDYLV